MTWHLVLASAEWLDRALLAIGRAVWRAMLDGFAAYAMAYNGAVFDPREHDAVAAVGRVLGSGDDDIRADYADLGALLASIRERMPAREPDRGRGGSSRL